MISSKTEGFVHKWVETKEKDRIEIMDSDGCNMQEEKSSETSNKQKTVYECDVEQGCTEAFAKFGDRINRILIGKYRCIVEKLSLKDTVMTTYNSRWEEVENRRTISIDMNLKEVIDDETSPFPMGWDLAIRKPNTGFSDKRRRHLKEYDEGVANVKQWKLKEVVLEIELLKENGQFNFRLENF